MLGVELEAIAKKYDRFGWDRDRGTAAQNRLISDWMAALQDYPLAEVQSALSVHVLDFPSKMPNEGHVVAQIKAARKAHVEALPRRHEPEAERERATPEEAARIMADVGFKPKMMGGAS